MKYHFVMQMHTAFRVHLVMIWPATANENDLREHVEMCLMGGEL